MAHLQYMPGDPRLVDQLVYELKSKGIFDQFRKDCISDVDTRPAYQNLRQRVESSVSLFLSRQTWKPDLNKNQLREKLRKHILDGNYLEQGVERIVDQVVNPKVASVFMPQVEDLVYNYLGIARKKSTTETSTDKGQTSTDLLPNDLEAVSPGSVKSDKDDAPEETREDPMEVDDKSKEININDISMPSDVEPEKETDTRLSGVSDLTSRDSEGSLGKLSIPMPAEEINLENIPSPENSPPKIDLDSIELPKEEPIELKDIPLPDESPKEEKDQYFKPINSEDDSSSDSSIIRNMSPLTPIRNFNNENSCDAQQAFENDSDNKSDDKKEPNSFRFTIDSKSPENSSDIKDVKPVKDEQNNLAYQFNEQVNINTFNTPLYDDSSNSHNLQIDYESDANSKTNLDKIPFPDDPTSEDSKKESTDEKKSLKSSHRSRDSHRHSSSSKDRKTDSKHSSSRDRRDPKQDKRSSKDDQSKSKSSSDKSKDRSDKKDSRDKDSKHRSSHKSSSSTSKDSKHRSSSSNQKHSSKHDDKDRKSSSSSNKDKEKVDKSSKEHKSSRDSKSSRSDKDKKSKRDDKDKDKKDKKDTDDHYSASGRGNHTRRSTDRDSNDGSSSSKGSHNQSSSKSSESKTNKGSSSKSDNTSPSSDSTSPSDKDNVVKNANTEASTQPKPVRVETHLEMPMAAPPRLPFVPDVTLKKPRFANNLEEAKRLMKMRKFLDEEQKRMNQEAALLLEFQANVRPSLSQVYSSISGPELEFACISNAVEPAKPIIETNYAEVKPIEEIEYAPGSIEMQLTEMNQETNKVAKIHVTTNNKKEVVKTEVSTTESKEVNKNGVTTTNKDVAQTEVTTTSEAIETEEVYESIEYNQPDFEDTEKILNEISKKVYGIVDDIVEDEDMREPKVKKEEEITEGVKNEQTEFEVTVITEEIDDIGPVHIEHVSPKGELRIVIKQEETPFEYFAEHEKFSAELERDKFEKFLKVYMKDIITEKLYLINCDSYEESVIREVANTNGDFEIINYHKNGHKNKNIVKNVNVSDEIVLPLDRNTPIDTVIRSTKAVLSPVKSECSFELSSDYDAKLEEMVNKTSRQEIMEIILGGTAPEESPSKLPQIDYCMEDNIERNIDLERDDFQRDDDLKRNDDLKRKLSVESLDNNNGLVLVPKMRKLSESDQISSTTEETPDRLNVSRNNVRSKYLGKARRVGLSRPKRTVHPNSPSSDKSVENYDTNSPPPNGKLKRQPHVRYHTHDLYKPKLHYLSRRNHIA